MIMQKKNDNTKTFYNGSRIKMIFQEIKPCSDMNIEIISKLYYKKNAEVLKFNENDDILFPENIFFDNSLCKFALLSSPSRAIANSGGQMGFYWKKYFFQNDAILKIINKKKIKKIANSFLIILLIITGI